jgi:hypothetical protein
VDQLLPIILVYALLFAISTAAHVLVLVCTLRRLVSTAERTLDERIDDFVSRMEATALAAKQEAAAAARTMAAAAATCRGGKHDPSTHKV